MNLAPFTSLIKEKTGLSFGAGRLAKLAEVIQTVMSAKGIHSPTEFYELILRSPCDFVSLVNLLTVNETYFFREPTQLKLLSERLAPELLKRRRVGAKIRILSAGCSTGEEPYSLVMALMERMGLNISALFEVIGVDIDSDAIYKAKKGVYGRQSFRGFDPGLKEKYFDKVGSDLYKLKDFVKDMVDLRVLNLSSGLYPQDLRNLDVIFYRNVSIYFEADTQRRIFSNLSRTLSEGGYFITSATETLSHNLNVLSLMEVGGVFFYQKSAGPTDKRTRITLPCDDGRIGSEQKNCPSTDVQDKVDPLPKWTWDIPAGKTLPLLNAVQEERCDFQRKDPEEAFAEALSLAEDKKYDLALGLVDELTAREPSLVRAYALKGNLLVNLGRLEEAERECLKAVEIDELCLEGYLLLGLIARKREEHDISVRRFMEALYVKPSCWLAHFYLAEIYYCRGELEKARREYSIILSLSEKGELADPGLSFFPLAIPVEQMIHLCRHKLARF